MGHELVTGIRIVGFVHWPRGSQQHNPTMTAYCVLNCAALCAWGVAAGAIAHQKTNGDLGCTYMGSSAGVAIGYTVARATALHPITTAFAILTVPVIAALTEKKPPKEQF